MRFLSIIIIALCTFLLASCKTTTLDEQYKGKDDKQIFEAAEHDMATKHYENAIKNFEALDAIYPFGQYSQQAQLDIIYAYYKHNDSDSALAAADRYIRLYPRSPNVDYAYYMKGIIDMGAPEGWADRWIRTDPAQRDVGGMEEAFQDFRILVQRFPDSAYAPDAQRRMLYIRNLLAQHNLGIARYYFKRKAYVAAANRANDVVIGYPQAPQVIPALAIMVKSYQALNETEMANQALQVLVRNYPDSSEAKHLQNNINYVEDKKTLSQKVKGVFKNNE